MADSDIILTRLLKLHPKLIDLELSRIEKLLARLGHPEKQLPPVIHIGGTNGKGSALAYLQAMFEAAGSQVHAYTSPHLVHFHERITLAGHFITEEDLKAALQTCEDANHGEPITYFEITTAAAFLAFSQVDADVLLLEVGLGGKFDATNVIAHPAATILTPINLDHQNFLGDTVEVIATEKSGIFKAGVPAIIGPQLDATRDVLEREAQRVGAPTFFYGQEWSAYEEHGRMIFQDASGLLDLRLPGLVGRHQVANAGTAIAVLRTLPEIFDNDSAIEEGLRTVKWPARMQRLTKGPLTQRSGPGVEIWLDGGHNPHAAAALSQTLADMEDRASRPLCLIFGMMEGKDAMAYLSEFKGLVKHVSIVPIQAEACFATEDLYALARNIGLEADIASDPMDALNQILARPQDAPRILICGSLYLAGQVLKENG